MTLHKRTNMKAVLNSSTQSGRESNLSIMSLGTSQRAMGSPPMELLTSSMLPSAPEITNLPTSQLSLTLQLPEFQRWRLRVQSENVTVSHTAVVDPQVTKTSRRKDEKGHQKFFV